MADMLTQPRDRINVASTVALLLAGTLAAPVLAAPERGLLCAEDASSTTVFASTELSVTPVNSSDEMLEDHLLRPRAKSAARGAFAEEAPENQGLIDVEEPDLVDEATIADPAAQSASKPKRPIYKRQMYRRDI
jgi:hypothetical protein